MARKFLYIVAVIAVLLVGARLAMIFWSQDLSEIAFVPDQPFMAEAAMASNAWHDPKMWIAHPRLAGDPSHWLPPGVAAPATRLPVAVFFVHPTSFIEKSAWNASIDNAGARNLAALFVKGMASPFNEAQQVWAPRYRQAAVGAFLTDKPEGQEAVDLAYGDVLNAFDEFVKEVPADEPIVLAGHSQGSYILRRLMKDRVAGKPLARRIVAAYVIGWPVSIDHDLPEMGLPACAAPNQSGCVVSWLSFADPSDTSMVTKAYARRHGLDGTTVGAGAFVCTNPLTGTQDSAASADANLGTLVPDFATGEGTLEAKVVPAACAEDHFLHIGPPPRLGLDRFVLPGNNYHVFDITLFWANLRRDFERRAQAYLRAHAQADTARQ